MDRLYAFYYWLPNFSRFGFGGEIVNRLLRHIYRFIFDILVIKSFRSSEVRLPGKNISESVVSEKLDLIIVSLTSYPARINDVWISIESIFRQSRKPDKVILWLASEQFPDQKLPKVLTDLQERGLEIRYCDDLRSHKKYFFVMQENPTDIIITIDDDTYYPTNTISCLIDMHRQYPDSIVANRAHLMKFNDDTLMPYHAWPRNHKKIIQPSHLLVQTGVGGVLYPPNSLSKRLFDQKAINMYCLNADDLWLKMNGYIHGTKLVTTQCFNKDFISVGKTQDDRLFNHNANPTGNDAALANIGHYLGIDLSKKKFQLK